MNISTPTENQQNILEMIERHNFEVIVMGKSIKDKTEMPEMEGCSKG
jgi:glycerol-3-phosphate cytidylyltransferase-like family protein